MANELESFIKTVRSNCNISDARDNGIYSMCMLFLRLRNLYKWEKSMEPWEEASPPDLLDWIAEKEAEWDLIGHDDFNVLSLPSPRPEGISEVDSMDIVNVNSALHEYNLVYGAGFGKSMKAVFFLAEKLDERDEGGCRTIILGKEEAKELASPFAMLQDDIILFRTEPFRYFLWDRVQEASSSQKVALQQVLGAYGLFNDCGSLDLEKFKEKLGHIVEMEMIPIIRHEVGEMKENILGRDIFEKMTAAFPGTAVELFVRALKDIFADLHPEGMLGWIICQEKVSSLGFYTLFLEGLRRTLFPELKKAIDEFQENGDWRLIEQARIDCLAANQKRAEKLSEITALLGQIPNSQIQDRVKEELLVPLGL